MTSLPFLYTDFHGGLNTKDAPYLLTDNEARYLQNIQGTTAGAIVKRRGLQTFATMPTQFSSLASVESTTSPYLIAAGSTHLYSIGTGGTVTSIGTGFTSNLNWDFVQSQVTNGEGPVYGMNGTDTPQYWSGATAGTATANWVATNGAVPNGKYMALAGNRIWVAGVAATPNRVFFSDLIPANNGPVSWPTANVAIFDENDGAPITGLGHVGPYLLVTKARKLYLITDFNTGDARRLSDNIGCVAHRTIAQAPEGTYFLAEDRGVYLTNGSKITSISDVIQPTIDTIQTRSNATATYFNGHYLLSVGINSSTSNDTTLDFDSALQSWWLHTFGSGQFAIWHPTGTAQLYSAKDTALIVDQCFVPGVMQDNGANFTWQWMGPWQSPTFYRRRRFPTPYFRKRFRQMRFDGAGTVDFSLATDFSGAAVLKASNALATGTPGNFGASDGTTYGGSGVFGDAPTIARARIYTMGVYNAVSIVFSATSATNDLVTSYVLEVTDRKDLIVS